MDWLEYILPLVFLTPLAATAVVVLGMRHLFQDKPGFAASGAQLRQSGHRFRERLAEARTRLFLACALGPVLVITPLIYGMGRILFSPQQDWIEWSLYGFLSTAIALVVGALMSVLAYRISRLRLRLACAMSVTWQLEQMMRFQEQVIHVFHDVPAGAQTIDHVIVTHSGVFSLIVKARRTASGPDTRVNLEGDQLRFPTHDERSPVRDARRARRWLYAELSRACRQPVEVEGLLMLPGWSCDEAEPTQDDVALLEEQALAAYLTGPRERLDDALYGDIIRHLSALAGDRPMHPPLSGADTPRSVLTQPSDSP